MKFLVTSGLLGLSLLAAPLQAEVKTPFAELLKKIEQEQVFEKAVDVERLSVFKEKAQNQKALLSDAKKELASLKAETKRLREAFSANEKSLTSIEEKQRIAIGALGEVFGVVRQVSGDFQSQLSNSIISSQYPGRSKSLTSLSESKSLPSLVEIKKMVSAIQRESIESGRIVTFKGNYVGASGKQVTSEITRIGAFNVVADGKYLNYLPASSKLVELARQPAGRYLDAVETYIGGTEVIAQVPVDPSRGAILSLIVDTPTLFERVEQGGVVGYVILALLLVGILLATERFVYLKMVAMKIKSQLASKKVVLNNPLGRILSVYKESSEDNLEGLELKLDEAIVRETPKLERGIKAVKLLAAIAPLLGLLGTVTGMIATFQAITMFGSGDPKLMAGGISQALVTTVLGLVAAIPLLLIHGVIASRSKEIIGILDEQSIGILAEKAEQGVLA